ncbi:glyoxalase/bleomycin resistance/dioxygenase family protein [bacterium]|nr:glyoxalase/bleomycin resistance/dioxygenase family protein [bacterium]
MSEKQTPDAATILTITAVDNLEKSGRFYDAVFGWERRIDVPVYIEYRLQSGQGFGLYARSNFGHNTGRTPISAPTGEATTATELYFHLSDPHPYIERLKENGARELSPFGKRDWGDDAGYFTDPDGNVIVIARSPV